MRIDVLTLFPAMFQGPLTESILKRGIRAGLLDIRIHDIRAYAGGKHREVDDSPYGGGAGMVMRADVVVRAIEEVSKQPFKALRGLSGPNGKAEVSGQFRHSSKSDSSLVNVEPTSDERRVTKERHPHRIYLSPRGKRLKQLTVERMAKKHDWILLLCGHYEGVDQRVIDGWIDAEISIGDYVLTGGELPAMVLIDALARHVPGVLGKEESAAEESFSKALKRKREYPHYTRPEVFRGMRVPDVLLSGNHAKIDAWRKDQLQ